MRGLGHACDTPQANENCQQAIPGVDHIRFCAKIETFQQTIYRGSANRYLEKRRLDCEIACAFIARYNGGLGVAWINPWQST
jgi:hypothetical protein